MISEEVNNLAKKIFSTACTEDTPDIIDKRITEFTPEDLAQVFTMLERVCRETAEVLLITNLPFTEKIDLSGLLLATVSNNCDFNIKQLARLKQLLKMNKATEN